MNNQSKQLLLSTAIAAFVAGGYVWGVITEPKTIPVETLVKTVHNAQIDTIEDYQYQTNLERQKAGLPGLTLSDKLTKSAQAKADEMVAMNYFEHYRPSDGKPPWDYMEEAGYNYRYAGENLAKGYLTAFGATTAWVNSKLHKENLLEPRYKEVGFGFAYDLITGNKITVQHLGATK